MIVKIQEERFNETLHEARIAIALNVAYLVFLVVGCGVAIWSNFW